MDPLWSIALLACPSTHWNGRLWSDHSDHPLPPESAEFWYITYHTLFWLDLYLPIAAVALAPRQATTAFLMPAVVPVTTMRRYFLQINLSEYRVAQWVSRW